MKRSKLIVPARFWLAIYAVLLTANSCEMLGLPPSSDIGELRLSFSKQQEALTRSGLEIPDTSDFLLTVTDSRNKKVFDGKYGDSPEALALNAGSYTVKIISEEFIKPSFSSPQFGDEQCVVVPAGKSVSLELVCRQINSGVKLKIDPGFLDEYPDGILMMKSSLGRLIYGYSEKRIGYFNPGEVSLVLNQGKTDKVLMTRKLKAQDILELKVSVAASGSASPGGGKGGLSVKVDTLRNWMSDSYVIGGDESDGSGQYDALTISEALSSIGEEGVWVSGYIVGGDLSSSSASFQKPFDSRTNLVLGPRSSTTDKEDCLSVHLSSGTLRDALNLVDNPGLLRRKICLKGDVVEAYYGIPGLKNITEYELL